MQQKEGGFSGTLLLAALSRFRNWLRIAKRFIVPSSSLCWPLSSPEFSGCLDSQTPWSL
jgi:hypothetical protein